MTDSNFLGGGRATGKKKERKKERKLILQQLHSLQRYKGIPGQRCLMNNNFNYQNVFIIFKFYLFTL